MNSRKVKRISLLLAVFWALVGVFLFIVSQFFVPAIQNLLMGSEIFLIPMIVFFLLGLALVFLAIREEMEKKLKRFFILTGLAAASFFTSVFLHNLFYALNIVSGKIVGLNYLTNVLSVAFFLIGIFICPLGFLVGLIGSLVLLTKRNQVK